MPRGNGSLIGVDAAPNANVASGIWTVRESETYLRANKWPATPTVPGAPSGTPGNAQVSLTWTAPTGGSASTDYIVQYSSDSGTTWTTFSDGVSTNTSATVTGLTNDTGYIFRIVAVNALGQGPAGSASGTITPLDLPAPDVWLDGADATQFTLDGSDVLEWKDKSGNARHFTYDEAAPTPPTRTSSAKNGKGAVAFSGTWMTGVYTYDIRAIFIVWEQPTTASDYPAVIAARSSAGKVAGGSLNFALASKNADQDTIIVDPSEPGTYTLNGSAVDSDDLPYDAGVAAKTSPDRWQRMAVQFTDTVSGSKPIVLGADTETADSRTMDNGHIAEILMYSTALSSGQIATVEAYLVAKWGL